MKSIIGSILKYIYAKANNVHNKNVLATNTDTDTFSGYTKSHGGYIGTWTISK